MRSELSSIIRKHEFLDNEESGPYKMDLSECSGQVVGAGEDLSLFCLRRPSEDRTPLNSIKSP